MALDNAASSPSSHILIGQFKRKPLESCEDVTKLSKANQTFVRQPWLDALDGNHPLCKIHDWQPFTQKYWYASSETEVPNVNPPNAHGLPGHSIIILVHI